MRKGLGRIRNISEILRERQKPPQGLNDRALSQVWEQETQSDHHEVRRQRTEQPPSEKARIALRMVESPGTKKLSRNKEPAQNEKQIDAHPAEFCNPMVPRNQAE